MAARSGCWSSKSRIAFRAAIWRISASVVCFLNVCPDINFCRSRWAFRRLTKGVCSRNSIAAFLSHSSSTTSGECAGGVDLSGTSVVRSWSSTGRERRSLCHPTPPITQAKRAKTAAATATAPNTWDAHSGNETPSCMEPTNVATPMTTGRITFRSNHAHARSRSSGNPTETEIASYTTRNTRRSRPAHRHSVLLMPHGNVSVRLRQV